MPRRPAAAALAVALVPFLLAIVLLAPATLGGKVLSAGGLTLHQPPFPTSPTPPSESPLQFDAANVFEPDGLLVRDALRDGRLPTWTQRMAAGRPLLAAQQSAPLFPLTWLGVAFPYYGALAWIAVLELGLAALGTVVFARALALRRAPALLAGLAYGFGTYFVVWLMHPHDNAYVLLPWLLWAAERLARRGAVRDGALLGLLLGIAYLSGQPESALIVSVPTALWLVYRAVAGAEAGRGRIAALGLGAVLLGAALGAVMLIPFAEALHESARSSRSRPPLPVRSLVSAVFPDFWGRPDRAGAFGFGPENFTERTLYVGALPLLLAAMGLVARRPRGPQLFFAVLLAGSLIVALDTGPIAGAVRGLPVVDVINANRVLIVASLSLALLAGFGLQGLLDATAVERRRMLLAGAACAVLPALAFAAARPSWLSALGDAARELLGRAPAPTPQAVATASVVRWLVLAVVSLGLCAAVAHRPRRVGVLAGVALALVALDLGAMGWGFNPAISTARAEPPAPPAVAALRRLTAAGGRVVGIGGLEPNTASRWGLDDLRSHEDPNVHRTDLLWGALGGGLAGATVAVRPDEPRSGKLLDVFGVRALLVPPSAHPEASLTPSLRGTVVYSGPGGAVIAHPTALPRAYVAYDWRRSPNALSSALLVAAGTTREARDAPVVESVGAGPAGPPRRATPARVTQSDDTAVTVDVTARAPGRLVLLDTDYPGWQATVDGHDAPIAATNAAFRSVAVGAGHHVVRFRYRPASVRWGGLVSLVALVLLAVGLAAGGRQAKRRSSSP